VFYIDLDGSADDANVAEALEEVRLHTSMLKVLGSYPSSKGPV
jgi:chorismate mutase/prephenate dehydratase